MAEPATNLTAYNLRRQINLRAVKQEELRRMEQSIAELCRQYSRQHGYCVPLTAEQCVEHMDRVK